VLLVPLLPLGMVIGVSAPLFSLFVIPHLICLLSAVYISIVPLFRKSSALFAILALFAFAIFIIGILPITSRDALIHHLAVPRLWINAGKITEISWNPWSYYPMLIQCAYAWFELVGLDRLTSLYHALYLFILAGTVAQYLITLEYSIFTARAGFFLTLTLPICEKLGITPLVDLPLALFSTQAVCIGSFLASMPSKRSLWISFGAALGLTVSTKPNGFLAAVSIALALLLQLAREKTAINKFFLGGVLSVVIACAIFSPWAVRSYEWTGNPMYSIAGSRSKGGEKIINYSKVPPMSALQSRAAIYGESITDIILLPVRIFIEGKDNIPQNFDGVLSPLLLCAFLLPRKRKNGSALSFHYFYALIFLLLAILLGPARVRYLAPAYGSWIILTATFLETVPQLLRLLAIWAHIALGFFYLCHYEKRSGAITYFTNAELGPNQYLSEQIPEWDMIQFINNNLPADSKTYLVLTGNKFYYYNRPVITSGYQSEQLLVSLIMSSANSGDLKIHFKEQGITHLLAEASRTRVTLQSLLPDEKKQLWNEFVAADLEEQHQSNDFILWKVK
jgi:hypothetical protein